jgi:hypothetical protein
VGTAVSVITGSTDINTINPALLAPIVRPKVNMKLKIIYFMIKNP